MTNTIASMLTENTGRHLCDSGDAYGRHWERNQSRDFASEPPASLSFRYGIDVTLNVYHWLNDRLSFDADMQARFEEYVSGADKHTSWLGLADGFPMHLREAGHEVAGVYGDGQPVTVNTYNGEDLLSQVIQYVYFTVDGTPYVALQIHNGADVRGGYTAPRIFEVAGEETSIFDNARAVIYCTGCDANWTTDDACNWYRDGACGIGAGAQLETYDRTEENKGEEWEEGKIHVLSNGDGLCPCCGSALRAQ